MPEESPNRGISRSTSGATGADNINKQGQGQNNSISRNEDLRIGWKTPCTMISAYVLGLLIAITHLTAFVLLDGSLVNNVLSQSQLTYASNFLASAFGASIRLSLAITFAQLFWNLVRKRFLRLHIIEVLYTLHSNFFSILNWSVWKESWVLLIVALAIWPMPIITSVPTSSMVVQNVFKTNQGYHQNLPGLNFSNTRNGNLDEVYNTSFFEPTTLSQGDHPVGILPLVSNGNSPIVPLVLYRLGVSTLISGERQPMASPCGANCSYNFKIDAPYLSCEKKEAIAQIVASAGLVDSGLEMKAFSAGWAKKGNMDNNNLASSPYQIDFYNLNGFTQFSLPVNTTDTFNKTDPQDEIIVNTTQITLTCRPKRAEYQLTLAWENNVPEFSQKLISTHSLISLQNPLYPPNDGGESNSSFSDWLASNRSAIDTIRDANLMELILAITLPIAGKLAIAVQTSLNHPNDKAPNITTGSASYTPVQVTGQSLSLISLTGMFSSPVLDNPNNPKPNLTHIFSIDETILNDYLWKLTLSAISQFGWWNITANLSQTESVLEFTFSRPLNLILPYFLTLAVCFPLLLLGLWKLQENGVSALDRSFLQIFATTRASPTLNNLALQCGLGGTENISSDLKEASVKYGKVERSTIEKQEIMDNDGASSAMAGEESPLASSLETAFVGFGLEGEVQPLLTRRKTRKHSGDAAAAAAA